MERRLRAPRQNDDRGRGSATSARTRAPALELREERLARVVDYCADCPFA